MATLDELIGSWPLSLRAADRAPCTAAQQLKEEMAERLLSLPADEVYDADLR